MTIPKLGWGVCGSFCTIARCCSIMAPLAGRWEITPILSDNVQQTDTRFGRAEEVCAAIAQAAGHPALRTIAQAAPLGPTITHSSPFSTVKVASRRAWMETSPI